MIPAFAAPTVRADLNPLSRGRSGGLSVDVSRLAGYLWLLVATILVLGVTREFVIGYIGTDTVLKDLRHFALDAERGVPSWYETVSMIASSLLLAVMAGLARRRDPANHRHWFLLAVMFFLMSMDSSVSFHEVTVAPLRNAFDLSGIFYFSWVLIATPLVLAVGLYFVPFLFRLPADTAVRFIIAGAIFVGGALGTEFICGYLATTSGMESIAYRTTAAAQECLEPIGLTLFIIALLRHLAATGPLTILLKDSR